MTLKESAGDNAGAPSTRSHCHCTGTRARARTHTRTNILARLVAPTLAPTSAAPLSLGALSHHP